jgi:hypothetical protein
MNGSTSTPKIQRRNRNYWNHNGGESVAVGESDVIASNSSQIKEANYVDM